MSCFTARCSRNALLAAHQAVKRTFLLVFSFLVVPAVGWAAGTSSPANALPALHRLDPQTPQGLQRLFAHAGEALPLVSAHRGGARKGFPENCLATFEETLRHTLAIMEIDPRWTKDGAIVLHHDPTLDRTTTGRGRSADWTLAEPKRLKLKDAEGNATQFEIPTLDEALRWARGKTVFSP